jgi:hypothetical protein
MFTTLEGARLRAAVAAATLSGLLNVWFLPAAGWNHRDFFMGSVPPVRALVDHLNREHSGEPVVFADVNQIAGLRGRAYTTTWHNENFRRSLQATRSPVECLRLLRDLGIQRAIAPSRSSLVTHPHLRKILGPNLLERDGWRIATLIDPPVFPPAGPGAFDDTDPRIEYEGEWMSGSQFDGASGGSVTYCNVPDASARLTFDGSEVTWIHTKAANRGQATVVIDGRAAGFDLHSPETSWQAARTFPGLGPGRHTVEIRVKTGYVDVDAFIVR